MANDPRGPAYDVAPLGYLRVRQEYPKGSGKYRIVRVHSSRLTPGQLAAAKANGLNTAAPEAPPKPATPAPAPAAPATPTQPASIDPRDATYQNDMARYAYELGRETNAINAERATLPSLYNRGAADIRTAYNRDTYDSNANLAARGLVRSGEYQRRGADRLMQQARQTSDLERQYGTGAQTALAQRLADINQSYTLNQGSAIEAARQRYQSNNPASTYLWSSLGG